MRCESTVTIEKSPADVFPWLLEADKVPQWMSGLQVYEPLEPGPLHAGTTEDPAGTFEHLYEVMVSR